MKSVREYYKILYNFITIALKEHTKDAKDTE